MDATVRTEGRGRAADLGGDEVALGQVRLEVDDAESLGQAARHGGLCLGEQGVAQGLLGRRAPAHGAPPRRAGRRGHEQELLLPRLVGRGQAREERRHGLPAAERVPPLPLGQRRQREEVAEHGQRGRAGAAEVAEHGERGEHAPPVGRQLRRRDPVVRERVGQERVQRQAHTGLERLRVDADRDRRRAAPAAAARHRRRVARGLGGAGGEQVEPVGDAVPGAEASDGLLRAERGVELRRHGPGERRRRRGRDALRGILRSAAAAASSQV
jgi:hypothetical protein